MPTRRKTDRRRLIISEELVPPAVVPIRATADPDRLRLVATAPVELQAAASEGKRPTFSIVGYTGAVMNVGGFYNPVIVDLTGLKAGGQEIPVFRNHDDDRIVGQTDSIAIGSDVRLTGTITGDGPDAAEIVSQAKNGFHWRASIGASVDRREFLDAGKTATVNGREVSGPLVIAREATLYEVSFVPIGADNATSANVAATSNSPASPLKEPTVFDQWLKAKGFDPTALSDAQRASLQAMYDAEQAAKPPAPTPAPTPAQTQTQTLDQIFAERRAEDARIDEITRITAQAVKNNPFMTDELERMSHAAIEARTPPIEYELAVLRLTRGRPSGTGFAVHSRDRAVTGRVMEAALCRSLGLRGIDKHYDAPTLEAADHRHRHGIGLQELLLIAGRENGFTGLSVRGDLEGLLRASFPRRRDGIQAEGFSTISLPGILSNVANKFLVQAFNAVEAAWRPIAQIRPMNDFKAATIYSLTGDLTYEKVGPAGEIKHGTLGELSYSLQAESFAKMLAITRTMIINDDLGALTEVPAKLGRGAALKLNSVFWTTFLAGVGTFWTSGRGNLITGAGTVLSSASLDQGNTAFARQTDPDGFPLGAMPSILLLPPELSVSGAELMDSTLINTGGSSTTTRVPNANVWRSKFQPVTSAYLSNSSITGYSTTAWYLLADPADLPTIAVGFLNGRETPIVESADADFDTLGIQMRGLHDFGVSLMEYRGSLRSAGA